jgi:hypothetical protein
VTVDAGREVIVRCRGSENGRVTELHLAKSSLTGKATRISVNRQLLTRALDLGLTEICIVSTDKPIVFQDEKRKLVAVTLGKETVVDSADNALHISSANGTVSHDRELPKQNVDAEASTVVSDSEPRNVRRTVSRSNQRKVTPGTLAVLVSEAEALKDELRQAYTRTHQLLIAIKKHRRQNKIVQSTLASLKQLKNVS